MQQKNKVHNKLKPKTKTMLPLGQLGTLFNKYLNKVYQYLWSQDKVKTPITSSWGNRLVKHSSFFFLKQEVDSSERSKGDQNKALLGL